MSEIVAPVPPRRNWADWMVDKVLPGVLVPAVIALAIYLYGATRVSVDLAILSPLPQGTIILVAQATGEKACPAGFDYLDSIGVEPSPTAGKDQGDRIGTASGKLWPLMCVKR